MECNCAGRLSLSQLSVHFIHPSVEPHSSVPSSVLCSSACFSGCPVLLILISISSSSLHCPFLSVASLIVCHSLCLALFLFFLVSFHIFSVSCFSGGRGFFCTVSSEPGTDNISIEAPSRLTLLPFPLFIVSSNGSFCVFFGFCSVFCTSFLSDFHTLSL